MDSILGFTLEELEKLGGSFTAEEINQQPQVWEEVIIAMESQHKKIDEFVNGFLQNKDKRIILTGAGSSAFAGEVCAPYLTKLLGVNVEAIATTDIVSSPENYLIKEIPTLLISFARSGNSPESVATVNLAEQLLDSLYQIIITCNEEGALSKKCNNNDKNLLLLMPSRCNDKSFAMTSSFSTMVLSCMAIFHINELEPLKKDIEKLVVSTEKFIKNNYENIKLIAHENFERIIYLGSNTLKGIARESALKVLELTAGRVNAGFDTPLGFRHGPKSVVNSSTIIVFYLSNDSYSKKYGIDLINEMIPERKGNKLIVIGNGISKELKGDVDYTLQLGEKEFNLSSEIYLPLQQLVFGQLLSFYKSCALGITPDNPCPTGEVNRVVKGVTIHQY